MPLPHVVARFNKRVTNRFIEPVARRSSGFAVVHHTGRVSGRTYRTPINLFTDGDAWIAALTYGPKADWVQNVVATGGVVETKIGQHPIRRVEVVDRRIAWPHLPMLVRGALRMLRVTDFLRLETDTTIHDNPAV